MQVMDKPTPTADMIAAELDLRTLASLDVPKEAKLLGDLVTSTSRVLLVGPPGTGKSLFVHAMAAGMATGRGFLHWESERTSRCLIIDGEMPSVILKTRAEDLIRLTPEIPPGGLFIYSLDRGEELATRIPSLGILQPLNTKEGQDFVLRLANTLDIDVVIFDNIMSLIAGDQREETTWSQTLPLIQELSRRRIGQIYVDHTGHDGRRLYGTATKAWRMDTVGIMTPIDDRHRHPGEVAFKLSFKIPGKARRRVRHNWQDFELCTVRLGAEGWTSDIASGPASPEKLSPAADRWYRALLHIVAESPTPRLITRDKWLSEAVRRGLVRAVAMETEKRARTRGLALLRKYCSQLCNAGLIKADADTIVILNTAT